MGIGAAVLNLPTLDIPGLGWPAERLGDAMTELARRAGIAEGESSLPNPKAESGADPGGMAAWIERAACFLGCEAEPVETTFAGLEQDLDAVRPGILWMPDGTYLAILRGAGRSLVALTPALSLRRIAKREVCRILRAPMELSRRGEVDRLLSDAGVPPRQREKAARILLSDQLGATRVRQCWMIRVPPGARASRWLGQARVGRNAVLLVAAHIAQYMFWLGAWWLMGRAALDGRIDGGMFAAWALLLITLIPFRLLTTWMQGVLGIGAGGLLKERLLMGALRLAPEEVRHLGIGQFLGQALEAEAVETLTLNGGIAALLSLVELAVAAVILGRTAILLAVWLGASLLLAAQFLKRYEAWTSSRRQMTNDLVENMVGQRTRLVQQPRGEWHAAEDQALDSYLTASRSLDRSGAVLVAVVPRGWLLTGLASLVPGFVANQLANQNAAQNTTAGIAVALAGILLAWVALRRLTGSLADIAGAWVAWRQVGPLFQAAARPEIPGEFPSGSAPVEEKTAKTTAKPRKIVQADRLTFRYRTGGNPVLQGCSLEIAEGDRILLEGPSGGGKTTFASLLSGMRQPETGVLLAGGVDLATLGPERWRKQVATAPQFHENHILTETLCFNLLMGRSWPPTPDDVKEAESVCRELGLGYLLEKMPGGMLQMVGESGWQLSHGERSRIYMARALLQGAELVVLDESFAALDPESLKVAMQCAQRMSKTLLVIAHP